LEYILFKLLVAASDDRLSQSWYYRGVLVIALLFILPVYKLRAAISGFPSVRPAAVIASSQPKLVPLPSIDWTFPAPLSMNSGDDWEVIVDRTATLWLLLASGLLLWNLCCILHDHHLIKQTSTHANSHLQRLAQEAAYFAGVRTKVQLWVFPWIQSPMLIGFFHPVVLLPSEQVSDKDARLILAHELTHFQRKDLWKKWMVSTIQCIHWFNPVVYFLNRDFLYWLETSCDEHIVSSLDRDQRKGYGYLLINYAPTPGDVEGKRLISLASCQRTLKKRISTMLQSNQKSHILTGWVLVAALAVSCFHLSAFAASLDPMSVAYAITVRDSDRHLTAPVLSKTAAPSDTLSLSGNGYSRMGCLSSDSCYKSDTAYYEAGTVINIYADWTPTDSALKLGVYSDSIHVPITSTVCGGKGSVKVTICQSGDFEIYVENLSLSQDADIAGICYTYH